VLKSPRSAGWRNAVQSTVAIGWASIQQRSGKSKIDLSDGGSTVSCPVEVGQFTGAVMVTGVDETTWQPALELQPATGSRHVAVAGTGAALGSETGQVTHCATRPDASMLHRKPR